MFFLFVIVFYLKYFVAYAESLYTNLSHVNLQSRSCCDITLRKCLIFRVFSCIPHYVL